MQPASFVFGQAAPDSGLLAAASAKLRQAALTGQPRQISLAVLTWARADLMSPSGKNSSGSASRQAA